MLWAMEGLYSWSRRCATDSCAGSCSTTLLTALAPVRSVQVTEWCSRLIAETNSFSAVRAESGRNTRFRTGRFRKRSSTHTAVPCPPFIRKCNGIWPVSLPCVGSKMQNSSELPSMSFSNTK